MGITEFQRNHGLQSSKEPGFGVTLRGLVVNFEI